MAHQLKYTYEGGLFSAKHQIYNELYRLRNEYEASAESATDSYMKNSYLKHAEAFNIALIVIDRLALVDHSKDTDET